MPGHQRALLLAAMVLIATAVVGAHAADAPYFFRDWFGGTNRSADGVDRAPTSTWFDAYRTFALKGYDASVVDFNTRGTTTPTPSPPPPPPHDIASDLTAPRLRQLSRSQAHRLRRVQQRAEEQLNADAAAEARVAAEAEVAANAQFAAETEALNRVAFASLFAAEDRNAAGARVKGGTPIDICGVAFTQYGVWAGAHGGVAPTALQLSGVLAGINDPRSPVWSTTSWVPLGSIPLLNYGFDPTHERARIRALIPLVVNAFLNRVQWLAGGIGAGAPALCQIDALEVSVGAQMMHAAPPGGFITDFAVGLEEETWGVKVTPYVPGKGTFSQSAGGVALPRSSKFFRIEADHGSDAPGGSVGGHNGLITITELITGPVTPINWVNRNLHRTVVNSWLAGLPGPVNNNDWSESAAPASFKDLARLYNAAATGAAVPAAYQLSVPWFNGEYVKVHDDDWLPTYISYHAGRINQRGFWPMPGGGAVRPASPAVLHHVQVNFECSLCALGRIRPIGIAAAAEPNIRDLYTNQGSRQILDAARAAAVAFLARNVVMSNAEWLALSNQHRCELRGLFTLFFQSALYWEVDHLWDVHNPGNSASNPNARTPLGVVLHPLKHWERHIKNFYNFLPKTNLHDLVLKLPWPLSDLVWRWHAHIAPDNAPGNIGNRRALTAQLHADFTAALNNAGSQYGGNIPGAPGGPRPWLPASGDYFNRLLCWFGHPLRAGTPPNVVHGYGTIESSVAFTNPPANVWHNVGVPAQHQLVLVMEAREIRSPLNCAFMEGEACVPGAGAGARLLAAQQLVQHLAAAATRFEP